MPSTPATAKLTVYLVDDHVVLRRGLAALIAAQPDMAVCGEALSPVPALAEIVQRTPNVAIVDLLFRERGGMELIARLRAQSPSTRILVFSICDERTHARDSVEAGADAYLMKNATPERLLAAIRGLGRERGAPGRWPRDDTRRTAALRPAGRRRALGRLSRCDQEIIHLTGRGVSATSIACHLHITFQALQAYRRKLCRVLHLGNRTKFVEFCVRRVRKSRRRALDYR